MRKKGCHFVAMTTAPGFTPSAVSASASFCSDVPLPYASAVSNQLMPPFRAASTTLRIASSAMVSQNRADEVRALRELPAPQADWRDLDVGRAQPSLFHSYSPSQSRMQAEKCPGAISRSGGRASRHRATANGQRGWKWQPRGRIDGAGDLALGQVLVAPRLRVRNGHRGQERFRVGVVRPGEEGVARRELHDPSQVHHGDPVAEVFRRGQVVRDEKVREAHVLLELAHELEDEGAHGHVGHGDGLVGHEEIRAA